jgi:carbon-monoxide dehydrogenase small subunit
MKNKQQLDITVNGTEHSMTIEPRLLLSDVIRDKLRLTGTKRACDSGRCGACTVLKDGEPIKSCSVMALQAQDWDIETIESLPRDGSHSLQKAFLKNNSFQCGFCTSGMLLRSKALLEENPNPSEEEIRDEIHGNICRCTGYMKIVDGIQEAAANRSD